MRPSIELGHEEARRALVEILRGAHAGELGAALAYDGHWRSLRNHDEIAEVHQIALDELAHRVCVGEMLAELGVEPDPWRERCMFAIGTAISWLCRVGGWFVPMYGAGRLESGNVREYEDAARFAVLAGYGCFASELLHLAEVEWDHERYFRSKAEAHWLGALVPLWSAPPARETIRERFDDFLSLRAFWRRRVSVAPLSSSSPSPSPLGSDPLARSGSCRRARRHETASERIRPIPCPQTSRRYPVHYGRS